MRYQAKPKVYSSHFLGRPLDRFPVTVANGMLARQPHLGILVT